MEAFKNTLLDKETLEQKQAVDALFQEQKAALCTESDVARMVGHFKCAGKFTHLSNGIHADTEIFSDAGPINPSPPPSVSHSGCGHPCVFDALTCRNDNRTKLTLGAKAMLKKLLTHPISDYETLEARRATLLHMRHVDKQSLKDDVDIERLEADVAWIYSELDETKSALYEMAYFTPWFAKILNRVPIALTALNLYKIIAFPLFGVLTPIICFVVPYMVLRWKIGLPLSFKSYLWIMYRSFISSNSLMSFPIGGGPDWTKHLSCIVALLFYFQSVFTSLEVSRALRIVCKCIDSRMKNIATFFSFAAKTVKNRWHEGIQNAFFPDVMYPSPQFINKVENDPLAKASNSGGFLVAIRTFGTSLSRYKRFNHSEYRTLARAFYATETLLHISRLAAHEDFCLVDWKQPPDAPADPGSPPSQLDLLGLWHPCLHSHTAIENNLIMGRSPECKTQRAANILLTGPNAGGKSMLIKASMISVLLAQTIAVAPCRKSATMTPFDFLSSQINMPDVKGTRSLFEEEMYRAKYNLDYLSSHPEARAFIVVDEIFSSTNPVEGISGAYAVALNLARRPQATCMISTHFTYLSRLHKTCDISNMQMPIHRLNENNEFVYPYKLVPGVCRQYIALELLQKNNFDGDVLDVALATKNAICSTTK